MPCLLKRSLLHVPRRTVTPGNVEETVKRGMTLWNNIYEPHAEKLYNKLGSYHPDFICTCSECLPCLLVSDLVILVHVFNPKSETPAIPFSRSAASHRSVLCCSGVGVDLLFMDTTPLLSLSFLGGPLLPLLVMMPRSRLPCPSLLALLCTAAIAYCPFIPSSSCIPWLRADHF